MELTKLLDELFPLGHDVELTDDVILGEAKTKQGTVSVIGTTNHVEIGVEHALALSEFVLDSTQNHPERAIVMLVDTAGQRLSRRDELLGINGYLGHLAKCLEIARRRGAKLISLVYSEAVSGGFLSFGLMADQIYALSHAQIRVMDLRAMSRVTKQPLEKLERLSQSSPVFAPGVENYFSMGAVTDVWEDNLSEHLTEALQQSDNEDNRATLGNQRGGRKLAQSVAEQACNGTA